MINKFIYLEWKAFSRSASFAKSLGFKILMGFVALYFILIFLALGVGSFYILKKSNLDPLLAINKFLILYFAVDLTIRLLAQKIPVLNIKPLLLLRISKPTIVHFSLGKTMISFFNIIHFFLFIPFTIVLLIEGYDVISVLMWFMAIFSLIYINNFVNILLSNKDNLLGVFIAVVAIFAGLQYYNYFNITDYLAPVFNAFFDTKWAFAIPVVALLAIYYTSFKFLMSNLYLDAGLSSKTAVARTEQLTWLNQFGNTGTFLKNDIKLIKRNKRSKTTVGLSVLFLFYGLLFFTNTDMYNSAMKIFGGVFVSGGFLIAFGQYVPGWDSSYYQLLMTQNVSYKDYLKSKWSLMVIATIVSTILASFYLYFGWETYLIIVVGAIYNIGVNSQLVLLGGAFNKAPIDLSSSKGAFGDKKAFNVKTMIISIPQLGLPVFIYWLALKYASANTGLIIIAVLGVLGLLFKSKVFVLIEKIYKKEKYATIAAYKQTS